MDFQPVRCPNCEALGVLPVPVVMEIATGLSRGKCRNCGRRVWAAADGRELRIGMVDAPLRRVKPQPVA